MPSYMYVVGVGAIIALVVGVAFIHYFALPGRRK